MAKIMKTPKIKAPIATSLSDMMEKVKQPAKIKAPKKKKTKTGWTSY